MRVVVAADEIGALTSLQSGTALAAGWPAAKVTVLPTGVAGAGFVGAAADLLAAPLESAAVDEVVVTQVCGDGAAVLLVEASVRPDGLALDASSAPLGAALAELLATPGLRRVYLDLAGLPVHDGGAGLLGALGASGDVRLDAGVAGLTGLQRLDLAPARGRLGAVELVGVVPATELSQPLLGLRGITSLRGRAAGLEAETLLRTDAALEQLARLAAPQLTGSPGAGACGGLGLAVLALGGRLTTGPAVTFDSEAGRAALQGADLVVTGCSTFDFATRGGGVVAAAAEAAASALAPCVVVAGEVLIGTREMRTLGVEAAYAVRESTADAPVGGDVTGTELSSTARRVARSWSW
ncbi:MAG: glycerate kinase [Friedmanniella sp.]